MNQITITLDPHIYETIVLAARRSGFTPEQWIRIAANHASIQVLVEGRQ